jgi:hypothetical protein
MWDRFIEYPKWQESLLKSLLFKAMGCARVNCDKFKGLN